MAEPEQPIKPGPASPASRTSIRVNFLRAVVGVAVIGAGVGIYLFLQATKPQPGLAPMAQRSLVVRAVPAVTRPVARPWIGYGSARAMSDISIAAEIPGRVVERPANVNIGAWVDRGDLIVRLDAAEFGDRLAAAEQSVIALEAQVERVGVEGDSLAESVRLAEAGVELSERELSRAREAFERGAASQNEIDRLERDLTARRRELTDLRQRLDSIPSRLQELRAQIARGRADAAAARRDFERARIIAPVAGVIQELDVNVGDRVSLGQRVARVVDISRVEAPIRMPVSAGGEIIVGDEITLEADGPSGREWRGVVARIAPVAEEASRSITVLVEIEQDGRAVTPGTLLPGQFLIGRTGTGRPEPRLIVPRFAVVNDRVFVVADGVARSRPVRVLHHVDGVFADIDPAIREWAVLDNGIEPGDLVIISNFEEISDGVPVQTIAPTAGVYPTAERDHADDEPREARQ